MLRSGYVQVASFRGIPIRAHWTMPFLCLLWSGLRFAPGAWIGAVFVVLLHELGHAYLARRYRLQVMEVMLHGLGGHCAYVGEPTDWQRSIVASGGVLAQAILLAITLPVQIALAASVASGGPSPPDFVWDLLYAWTWSNAAIAVFNLLPIGRLDGTEIWKLPGLWLARRRRRGMAKSVTTKPPASTSPRSEPGIRARSPIASKPATRPSSEPMVIDEDAVKDTVRRALEEARKSSGQRPE
ncbi:MAG: hypothetical protein J0L92_28895 [Deltaproteobacteria bacterium]|nr:hypothetical protein [Deltaproteobacteria bacterium]